MGEALRGDAGAGGRGRGDPARARHLTPLRRLLLLALVLAAPPAAAQAPRRVDVGDITVVAPDPLLALGIRLAEEAGRPREWPGLGRRAPGAFRLVVVPDEAALARVSGGRAPAWGAAVTLPQARLIMFRADAEPLRSLRHELAHLVLHEAVRGRRPLWFDEGYAVWGGEEWDIFDRLALNLAVVTGATPSLGQVDAALRGTTQEVDAAYALAASAVIALARAHPTGSLAPLLERLAAGEPFDDAVRATTGLSLEDFEARWRKDVRQRFGLLTWLGAGGAWALFGLLVLVAARVRRHLDAPRRAALDEGWTLPAEDAAAAPVTEVAPILDPGEPER